MGEGADTIELTRGEMRFTVKGRSVRIQGEAYVPRDRSPYFVAYQNSLRRWDDGQPVSPEEAEIIWAKVRELAAQRRWTIEVE